MIVVDANLIGYLLIESEQSALAIQVFEKDPDWYAPVLWQSEVRSILTSHLRYRGLPGARAIQIMDEANDLMLQHERFVPSQLVMELVQISKCTAYDCEYVALAKEMNLTLVTFDKQVVTEFPRLAVFPQDFIKI